jgi:hypothetical protein
MAAARHVGSAIVHEVLEGKLMEVGHVRFDHKPNRDPDTSCGQEEVSPKVGGRCLQIWR